MLDSKLQPIGESSSHVTDDGTMILKGKTRDPNYTLIAQYLETAGNAI